MKYACRRGFTLIEFILVVSLVIFVGLLADSFYGRFLFSQEQRIVQDAVEAGVTKARTYAMAGKRGSAWGVTVQGQRLILFQGETFASRDSSVDETFDIHPTVHISGLNEIVFDRPSGIPASGATIIISGSDGSKTLSLNAYGVLEE